MQLAWRTGGTTTATAIDDDPEPSPAVGDRLDELAIIERAKVDPHAFAPLYQRYAPIVHNYCLRRLSDPEAAADATSQIFTKAMKGLHRFSPDPARAGSTFRSWLFTIARNVVIDTRRRHRTHRSLDTDPTLAGSPHLRDRAASPEDLAMRSDESRRVRRLLERLPDRQRRIVELRLAGLTGAEIARTLSMSGAAVKSAQFRAYATLRTLLNADDPDHTGETR